MLLSYSSTSLKLIENSERIVETSLYCYTPLSCYNILLLGSLESNESSSFLMFLLFFSLVVLVGNFSCPLIVGLTLNLKPVDDGCSFLPPAEFGMNLEKRLPRIAIEDYA